MTPETNNVKFIETDGIWTWKRYDTNGSVIYRSPIFNSEREARADYEVNGGIKDSLTTECNHCWSRKTDPIADHSDCDNCCVCKISYIDANKDVSFRCKMCGDKFSTPEKAKNCNHDYLIAKEVLKSSSNVEHKSDKEIPRTDDRYATLIGGLILNVGNLYNENKQDITVRVAEYVYKNYIK